MKLLNKLPGKGNRTIASAVAWGLVRYAQAEGWVPEGTAMAELAQALEVLLGVAIVVFHRLGVKNDAGAA